MSDVFEFQKAKCPEEVGVDSHEIKALFEDMHENNLEFHSFMVVRGGKIACEFYREPFNAEMPHAVYSVSKTFTSTAVGFAVNEGFFSLDTRLLDVFPEYAPKRKDERLEKLTVRHLITMTAGKNPSVLADKGKIDWIEDYFKSPWYGEPGTFRYVNENIFMLCAIIHRTTGMSVREFLTPRFFEPLGIEVPFWETDKNGIEAGGWGIYVKLRDLAKLMYCYQNGGKAGDRQILPEGWAEEASVAHADNSMCKTIDSDKGYGYCLWRNGGDIDSYRADGMFSQFGIVFEKDDALVISMGGIADEQEARDCLWRHFPKAFIEPDKKAKKAAVENFSTLSEKYPVEVPASSMHSLMEAKLNCKTISLRKNVLLNIAGFPVSVLPLAVVYMTSDRAGNINNINFNFKDYECTMSWTEGDEKNTVVCGMDGHLRYGTMQLGGIDYLVCCSAEWKDDDTLIVNIRPVTTVAKRRLQFSFKADGRVKVKPSSTPKVDEIGYTLCTALSEIFPCEPVINIIRGITKYLPDILEPNMNGKLTRRKQLYGDLDK